MLCCRPSRTLTAISDELAVSVQVSHCIPGGPKGSNCTRRLHYEWKRDGATALIQLNDARKIKPFFYGLWTNNNLVFFVRSRTCSSLTIACASLKHNSGTNNA